MNPVIVTVVIDCRFFSQEQCPGDAARVDNLADALVNCVGAGSVEWRDLPALHHELVHGRGRVIRTVQPQTTHHSTYYIRV